MKIAKFDPCGKLLQNYIRGQTLDLNPIELRKLVARVGNPCLRSTVISQYDQAFGIGVQPAGCVDLGDWNEVGQGRAPGQVGELGQYAKGLVEQYEATQIVLPSPKTLQNRCESG